MSGKSKAFLSVLLARLLYRAWMHTIYRITGGLLLAGACCGLAQGADIADIASSSPETIKTIPEPLSGTVEAALNHDETAGTWALQVTGSFQGNAVHLTDLALYGTDAQGHVIAEQPLGQNAGDPPLPTESPFTLDLTLQKPDPHWAELSVGMGLTDAQNAHAEIRSDLFPILWKQPVLIDHAFGGTVLSASNYDPGGIPEGVGIPHTLINSVPEGDYYAVVFFSGLGGCPSENYEINSFRADAYWGYDIRGSMGLYSKAFPSSGCGCMQEFHVDPAKGDDWLWGALSNTGTSSAIADTNGIPAFAICATKSACDPIVPSEGIASSSTAAVPHAVSSVLFLPGIKGSELYEDNPLCFIPSDTCGAKVWLPLADAAVPELFLDPQGKSKRTVFVRDGDILASAFGERFYASFQDFLANAKANGTFGNGWDWRAVAYDWRLSLPDIVGEGSEKDTRIYFDAPTVSPYLEDTLRELASSSPTGKVTVVAHSNGGLVAKALMQSLGDTIASQLIDSVIFVGVPQSGAPRALGALLYGDAEGIPGIKGIPDFIMSAAHAREFGLNSPMAYHLLPSVRYLSAIQPDHPLVAFEDGDLLSRERVAYGPSVDTEDELKSFSLAADSDRTMPNTTDLNSANILNAGLFQYAQDEHATLDAWQPPHGITVYEVGGYGVPTISGIDLYQSTHRDGSASLAYRPMFTQEGDGTVPVISALMMNASDQVHQVWLNLRGMRTSSATYSHANLLEAPDLEAVIADILHGSPAFPATAYAMDVASPLPQQKTLNFFVHSPVGITVVDENGNRTSVGDSSSEEAIPESTSGTLGEVKYVIVPSGSPYTLSLDGEASGTFTLDMQEQDGDTVIASSTIADVPVTPATSASLTISDSLESASPLVVDEDGNGSADLSIVPVLGSTVLAPEPASPQPVRRSPTAVAVSAVQKKVSTLLRLPLSTSTETHPVPHRAVVQKAATSSAAIQKVPVAITPVSIQPREKRDVRTHQSLLSRVLSYVESAIEQVLAFFKKLGGRQGA